MKISFLLTVATVVFVGGYAQADIFPDTQYISKCKETWAVNYKDTPDYGHALKHCDDLQDCLANQTTDKLDFLECASEAKTVFMNKTGQDKTTVTPVASKDTTAVVTEVADSDYELQGGDAKGWKNSTQGD